MQIKQLIVAWLADEDVRRALREAVGNAAGDEWVPLTRAAKELDVRARVLRDAAARGELAIAGPRSARGVWRSELTRWLASHRVAPSPPTTAADNHDEVRGSVVRAAGRFSRRPA